MIEAITIMDCVSGLIFGFGVLIGGLCLIAAIENISNSSPNEQRTIVKCLLSIVFMVCGIGVKFLFG